MWRAGFRDEEQPLALYFRPCLFPPIAGLERGLELFFQACAMPDVLVLLRES